jgi:large subunit ribosomal protein L12
MEYVYAALLLHKLKQDITEDNVTNVIKATGSEPDAVRIKALVAALGDMDIEATLKAAPMTMATPAAAATSASATGATAPETATTKETAEEEKTEKKEEEALEGLSSLFG